MYHISKEKTGKRLRKLMEINKMSVRELQEELDVDSPQAVYKWINGKAIPSLENLFTLSRLFGVPMEGLLEVERDSEEMEEKETLWMKSHPPVFMEHHCMYRHPSAGTGSKAYAIRIESAAKDRIRTEQGMKNGMKNDRKTGMEMAVQPDADTQRNSDMQCDAGTQPDADTKSDVDMKSGVGTKPNASIQPSVDAADQGIHHA